LRAEQQHGAADESQFDRLRDRYRAASARIVPVLLVWVLRAEQQHGAADESQFDRLRDRYRAASARIVGRRWMVVSSYFLIATLIIVAVGGSLGREIFPVVDAGQFAVRMRAAPGTRIEETEKLAKKFLDIVGREVGCRCNLPRRRLSGSRN
jgi:multidrug efflux pump subunit AcrB